MKAIGAALISLGCMVLANIAMPYNILWVRLVLTISVQQLVYWGLLLYTENDSSKKEGGN